MLHTSTWQRISIFPLVTVVEKWEYQSKVPVSIHLNSDTKLFAALCKQILLVIIKCKNWDKIISAEYLKFPIQLGWKQLSYPERNFQSCRRTSEVKTFGNVVQSISKGKSFPSVAHSYSENTAGCRLECRFLAMKDPCYFVHGFLPFIWKKTFSVKF